MPYTRRLFTAKVRNGRAGRGIMLILVSDQVYRPFGLFGNPCSKLRWLAGDFVLITDRLIWKAMGWGDLRALSRLLPRS